MTNTPHTTTLVMNYVSKFLPAPIAALLGGLLTWLFQARTQMDAGENLNTLTEQLTINVTDPSLATTTAPIVVAFLSYVFRHINSEPVSPLTKEEISAKADEEAHIRDMVDLQDRFDAQQMQSREALRPTDNGSAMQYTKVDPDAPRINPNRFIPTMPDKVTEEEMADVYGSMDRAIEAFDEINTFVSHHNHQLIPESFYSELAQLIDTAEKLTFDTLGYDNSGTDDANSPPPSNVPDEVREKFFINDDTAPLEILEKRMAIAEEKIAIITTVTDKLVGSADTFKGELNNQRDTVKEWGDALEAIDVGMANYNKHSRKVDSELGSYGARLAEGFRRITDVEKKVGLTFPHTELPVDLSDNTYTVLPANTLQPVNERHNNPLNILATAEGLERWEGEIHSGTPYALFSEPVYGVRAALYLLSLTYYFRHNLRTIHDIIMRWAPPEGEGNSHESTNNYIIFVSEQMGINRATILKHNKLTYLRLVDYMAQFEGGKQLPRDTYTGYVMQDAWDRLETQRTKLFNQEKKDKQSANQLASVNHLQ